ncbi:MAG: LLM class flavin-dependent oxidoreductase [Candidatus Dormiibacterota bacterium]
MDFAFAIDPAQGLSREDELDCVRLGAELGYLSAWTPGTADASAFDRCRDWFRASGLTTGIAVVPASGQPPSFYADQAIRVWEESGGKFVLGVGSGQMAHAAKEMSPYLANLRDLLPAGLPLYVAALGPRMLALAAETAEGVSLNWCSARQVAWSRAQVEASADRARRPVPVVAAYIRTAIDRDPSLAARVLGAAMQTYALGPAAYRRHFKRMGFGDELAQQRTEQRQPSPEMLSAVGVGSEPSVGRRHLLKLAQGLDLAIVRVLVCTKGDANSARAVLEECRPD